MTFRDEIAQAYIREFEAYVGKRESAGYNRSPEIDRFNRMAKEGMGVSYCCSAATGIFHDMCTRFGLKNPVLDDAGTQDFFDRSPAKYKSMVPRIGDIGILQNRFNTAHGHAFAVRGETKLGVIPTVEANTNIAGSRDGDGFYNSTRLMTGSATKRLRGFVDVCQMVADANPGMTLLTKAVPATLPDAPIAHV